MKPRPFGFALLAFLFGWLTVAGLGNAALQFSQEGPLYSSRDGALAVGYAAATGFSTYGLWRVREWVVTSLRLWMLVCAVLLLWLPVGAFGSLESFPPVWQIVPIVSLIAIISLLFFLLDRYVTRRVRLSA